MNLNKSERGWKGVVIIVFVLQQAFARLESVVHFLLFLGNCHWINMCWFLAPFTMVFLVHPESFHSERKLGAYWDGQVDKGTCQLVVEGEKQKSFQEFGNLNFHDSFDQTKTLIGDLIITLNSSLAKKQELLNLSEHLFSKYPLSVIAWPSRKS